MTGENVDMTEKNREHMGVSQFILKQVQVFFRHGARTPIVLVDAFEEVEYCTTLLTSVPQTVFDMEVVELQTGGPQPYSASETWYAGNTLKGGCKRGQLTTVGQVQTYSLGRKLRKEYIDTTQFLSDDFNSRSVFLRATNTARAIDSLRCCMSGLFGAEELNNKGPVTVYVCNTANEILYGQSCAKNCPAIRQLKQDAMVNSLDQPEFKHERLKIERALSIDSSDTKYEKLGFVRLRDDIASREVHGLYIPPEARVMRKRIEKNALKSFYYSICGQTESMRPQIMRLTGGPILSMINKNLTSESTTKLFMYSVHDWTILAVLAPLGQYDEEWPPFAADIRIELYENQFQEKFVQMKYLGVPRLLFGCTTAMCPYETFLAGVEPYLINDAEYRTECQVKTFLDANATPMDKGLETVL